MSANTSSECPDDSLPPDAEYANYRDPGVSAYRDHPLIEALPSVMEEDEVLMKLKDSSPLPVGVRRQPPTQRMHELVNAMGRLYIPTVMATRIHRAIELMLYRGYVGRNPIRRLFNKEVIEKISTLHHKILNGASEQPKGSTMLLRGIPGMGKSRVVERCLSLYRPIIYHTKYRGMPLSFQQRVWVKLDCPSDGSVRGLCTNFLQELDRLFMTDYYERYRRLTKYELVPIMANLVLRHGVGILVIDEIQNLLDARIDGERVMLNFFVQLENTLGLPILLVGTYAADALVLGRYHQRRRAEAEGHFEWTPMEYGAEWNNFTEALWTCQVIKKHSPWNEALSEALHEVSFGVTDIALRVYRFAQEEVIDDETEKLTVDVIRETARKYCPLTAPIIEALRNRDWGADALEGLDDVLPLNRTHPAEKSVDQSDAPSQRATPPDATESSIHAEAVSSAAHSSCRTTLKERKKDKQSGAQKKTHSRQACKKTRSHLQTVVEEGRAQGKSGAQSIKDGGLLATPSSAPVKEGGHP